MWEGQVGAGQRKYAGGEARCTLCLRYPQLHALQPCDRNKAAVRGAANFKSGVLQSKVQSFK